MSLFNLSWFRQNKEKEEKKVVEGPQFNLTVTETSTKHPEEVSETIRQKPYKRVNLVSDVLTVVLQDGSVLHKPGCTKEDYEKIKLAKTIIDILKVISTKEGIEQRAEEEKEFESAANIRKGFDMLKSFSDFRVEENAVYLTGINRSLPELLINKFVEILGSYSAYSVQQTEELLLKNEMYQALKRFFMWCCLNPRAEVADQLYEFLMKNDFKITKQGFFVALRNVVRANDAGQHELVNFITNVFNKVKTVWKKKPIDYAVYRKEDNTFCFEKITEFPKKEVEGLEVIGNLCDLYKDLPNMKENRYTDNWSHSFDIRIGKVVNMPPESCSWSTADCAEAGLHFAGHTAPYVLCGDTTVFTLHNPMKVVGIGTEKGRCWEYLPFMTTTVKEADSIMNSDDFDFLQLDEKYAIDELNELAEKVKNGFVAETSKHEFNLPKISTVDIQLIVNSLQTMKEEISNRVSLIK